jgi:hypothetical protein
MGNASSISANKDVFKKELKYITDITNNILSDDNTFKNQNYNFLSKNICENYKIILETDLKKHMKINIDKLGSSLYVIPNEEDLIKEKKTEVCKYISTHYIKILYVLSLIKYVYNVEKYGDLSIAGIIFRNIVLLDNIMEINYCDAPHRNYGNDKDNSRLDFSNLEGFSFFIDYFLDKEEAISFIKIMKTLLKSDNKKKLSKTICKYDENFKNSYYDKYNEKLNCKNVKQNPEKSQDYNLLFMVGKDNPVLSKLYCYAHKKIIFKIDTKEGKKVYDAYAKMKKRYDNNIKDINNILNDLVYIEHVNKKYILKDLDKKGLDNIIEKVKQVIKNFYINSIIDFQTLLKEAKKIPKITA